MSSKECGLGGEKLLTKPWKLLLFLSAVPKATRKTPTLRSMAEPWPVILQGCDSPPGWLSCLRPSLTLVRKQKVVMPLEQGKAQ